jgi:hypothetical protein
MKKKIFNHILYLYFEFHDTTKKKVSEHWGFESYIWLAANVLSTVRWGDFDIAGRL